MTNELLKKQIGTVSRKVKLLDHALSETTDDCSVEEMTELYDLSASVAVACERIVNRCRTLVRCRLEYLE